MTAWSKRWRNLKIATWNCFSLSKERKSYCESLGYDILALTELRNKQQMFEHCKNWIPSATAPNYKAGPKQGQSSDPAAGVAILLSSRMKQHYRNSGHVGACIAWVRLAGPIVNIFFVVTYLPHKYRTEPCVLDTLEELEALVALETLVALEALGAFASSGHLKRGVVYLYSYIIRIKSFMCIHIYIYMYSHLFI